MIYVHKNNMKLKKHNIYKVEWVDIQHDDSWTDFDTIDEKLPLVSYVGYFISEVKDCYIFASGYSTDDQYYSVDWFPKGVVKKISKLQ